MYPLDSNDPACSRETNTVEKAEIKHALVADDPSVGVTEWVSQRGKGRCPRTRKRAPKKLKPLVAVSNHAESIAEVNQSDR
jgi:hypothetical protein